METENFLNSFASSLNQPNTLPPFKDSKNNEMLIQFDLLEKFSQKKVKKSNVIESLRKYEMNPTLEGGEEGRGKGKGEEEFADFKECLDRLGRFLDYQEEFCKYIYFVWGEEWVGRREEGGGKNKEREEGGWRKEEGGTREEGGGRKEEGLGKREEEGGRRGFCIESIWNFWFVLM